MSGLVSEFVLTRSVRDLAALLDWVSGPEPGDPYAALPPERPYVEELRRDPGKLRIALLTDPLTDDTFAPEVVAAAEDTARKIEALGHEIIRPDLSGASDGVDLFPTFMTRWAAGNAANADTIEMIIGRPLTADDVEPLTWALTEQGRRESGADYLGAVARHQILARMVAGLHDSGIDLLMTPTVGELPPAARHLRRFRPRPDGRDRPRPGLRLLHRSLQRDRPAGHLAASRRERRAAGRHPVRRPDVARGPAGPDRGPARAGPAVGGPATRNHGSEP